MQEEIHPYKVFQPVEEGAAIFREGEPDTGVYFIQSGKVKVCKEGLRDKYQVLYLLKEADILGDRGIGTRRAHSMTAVALENTSTCYLPEDIFFRLLKRNPDLGIQVMLYYAAELEATENRLRNMSQMTVRERIADALLWIRNTYGTDESGLIALLSRKDIAGMAGTNPEQVSRFLNEFEEDGYIALKGRHIALIKPNSLIRMLEPYYHSSSKTHQHRYYG